MEELPGGVRRVTLPLPMPPGHVHAYLLPGEDGWTLVDTGLGLPDARERWQHELGELHDRVVRLVVTHYHPDHVGAAADVVEITGARAMQSELDYRQCRRVWGSPDWPERISAWFVGHGAPHEVVSELLEQGSLYTPFIRYATEPEPLYAGNHVDGWEVLAMPGHADGLVCLHREGVLLASDHLLPRITPTVGLWPESSADPLGDYLGSLERTIELGAAVALPGHGEPIHDPAGRARELIEHHRARLDETHAALHSEPRTAYEISHDLFGADLSPATRRFAIAETLSHVVRLVAEGRAAVSEGAGAVAYTAA